VGVAPERASYRFIETPARRTLHLTFSGRPDRDALRAAAADAAGAFVRVRWQIAEEDRHGVDRDEIARLFADAAELKLEGRIVPLLRARSAGISAVPTLADKLRRWAELAGVDAEPLVERLAWLQAMPAEDIARRVVDDAAAPAGGPGTQPWAASPEGEQVLADLFGE